MRIRILSDLHLEFQPPWRWPDDRDDYDVLAVAGEVAEIKDAVSEMKMRVPSQP